MVNGRVTVEWPKARPNLEPEIRAVKVSARLAEPGYRLWHHEAVRDVAWFGAWPFFLPVVCGHVLRMLRLEGADDDTLQVFIAGELAEAELRSLYATAERWVCEVIEDAALLGAFPAVWARIGHLPKWAEAAGVHVHRHSE